MLAQENERLKKYVHASIAHIRELEEVEIEEHRPLREYEHVRASLTKIKDDVDQLGEIETEEGLYSPRLPSLRTHIKKEVDELEEVEIEENKPLREYIRTSLTKIKENVDELGDIEMEDGLLLSSLTTVGEDDDTS